MVDENIVWEFTNKRKLNKKEFLHYIEKKVFKTIRKYDLLPEDRKIILKDDGFLNTVLLKFILEKKFKVDYGDVFNFVSDNLTDVAENAFKNVLAGNFDGLKAKDKFCRPLYDLTDEELEKYGELLNLKGKKRERDEKIVELFEKFKKKNPDLDHNIVNAMAQVFEVI